MTLFSDFFFPIIYFAHFWQKQQQQPSWSILRDDFSLKSAMKNWESEEEGEGRDSDDDGGSNKPVDSGDSD